MSPARELQPPDLELLTDESIRSLFGKRFLLATQIYTELVAAACWEILERIGALPDAAGLDPAVYASSRGLPPRAAPPLRYLLENLAAEGFLSLREGRYHPGSGPALRSVDQLARELIETVPEAGVGAEVVTTLVAEAPAFFAGEKTGEEILFAPNRLPLWFRYFSNENLLYSINNLLGAEVLARELPERARVLEVGGGCGSAAEAAIRRASDRIGSYRFTEVVPTFLRRGERTVRAAAAASATAPRIECSRLDMTRPWADQGIPAGSVDVVYSVNCFHVAPELDAVLAEARQALAPGGAVVVSECLRPTARRRPIFVEFIFNFLESFTNVTLHPVKRPTHGFLSPTAWRASFEAAGLTDVTVVPDVDRVAARHEDFVVGVVVAREGGPACRA